MPAKGAKFNRDSRLRCRRRLKLGSGVEVSERLAPRLMGGRQTKIAAGTEVGRKVLAWILNPSSEARMEAVASRRYRRPKVNWCPLPRQLPYLHRPPEAGRNSGSFHFPFPTTCIDSLHAPRRTERCPLANWFHAQRPHRCAMPAIQREPDSGSVPIRRASLRAIK